MKGNAGSYLMIVWIIAIAVCFTMPARAHEDDRSPLDEDTLIKFEVDSSTRFNPAYDLMWEAMQPMYKGTIRDKTRKDAESPIIGNAQIDLNGDNTPEIIAYHVESEKEKGKYCKKSGLCPYFVIDQSGKKIHQLGKIYAFTIDRGDSIKNGYWTLKVFTVHNDLNNYTTYYYDPIKKIYVAL